MLGLEATSIANAQKPPLCKNEVRRIRGISALMPVTQLKGDYSRHWKIGFCFLFGNQCASESS
jgi:hypothetical protein